MVEKIDKATLEPEQNLEPVALLPDLRSPLERFRTKPRKTLSVTDLVSPSWCELQYWYTLTKHGKKRATPAMRKGSKVHKALEDQVHRTVVMNVQTKEEAWGLRLWNIIQGLQSLRETGMTREMEVWGIIHGQVVNGVIDELSYNCPDRELEENFRLTSSTKNTLPTGQPTLVSFLKQQSANEPANGSIVSKFFKIKSSDEAEPEIENKTKKLHSTSEMMSRIYLTDVKTRAGSVKSMPQGASFRPTLMQLMLYHRLFSEMATGKIDPHTLFNRHGLRPNLPFGDSFISQIAAINSETFYDAPSPSYDPTSEVSLSSSLTVPQDTIELLLAHNSLHSLWTLMMHEFGLTIPHGATNIGDVLKVEYRSQSDGAILGIKTFLYEECVLSAYLEDGLRWWRGERDARGVCVEEAYKCGFCEFADDCDWRKTKVEDAVRVHRDRTKSLI